MLYFECFIEQNLKEVYLPSPHGDDDVPKTPEPPEDDDLDSLSSEIDIPLPGDEKKTEPPQEDRVKVSSLDLNYILFICLTNLV